MRWLGLVALIIPSLALARTVAESEVRAREQIVPRLDRMCGTQLDVHYDAASLGKRDLEETCEEPLRYLYYACQDSEARHAIERAHLRRYECRGVGDHDGKITVEPGKIVLAVEPHDRYVPMRIGELSHRLLPGVSLFHFDMQVVRKNGHRYDERWDAFIAAPLAVPTATDYCLVGDATIALPPTGDPLAPPHVRVKCVRGGKVVTDLSADGSGFSTRLDGATTRHDEYKLGRPDGESWVRKQGLFLERSFFVDGRLEWHSDFDVEGRLRFHENTAYPQSSRLVIDDNERVKDLMCGSGAATDPVLRDWCGYDAPRKLTIYQSGNVRTVIMTNGKARIAE